MTTRVTAKAVLRHAVLKKFVALILTTRVTAKAVLRHRLLPEFPVLQETTRVTAKAVLRQEYSLTSPLCIDHKSYC